MQVNRQSSLFISVLENQEQTLPQGKLLEGDTRSGYEVKLSRLINQTTWFKFQLSYFPVI